MPPWRSSISLGPLTDDDTQESQTHAQTQRSQVGALSLRLGPVHDRWSSPSNRHRVPLQELPSLFGGSFCCHGSAERTSRHYEQGSFKVVPVLEACQARLLR